QLETCAAEESQVVPCGVPGLRLGDEPASWQAQAALFRETAVEFFIRLITFQSLDGWGGLGAFIVTSGPLGELSFAAWLSAIGVVVLGIGAFNLLPVPTLIGFEFLRALGRWVTGRGVPENVRIASTWAGLLAILILSGRAAWVDLRWLWQAS